jgi:hypothetical protein
MRLRMLFVCGALVAAPHTASASSFDVGKPFLAKRGDGYAFVYTVSSSSVKDRAWVVLEVNNPDGTPRCEWVKTVENKQTYRFECPVEGVAGQSYLSRVRVFTDPELTNREVHTTPDLTVTASAIAEADKEAAKPIDAAIVVVPNDAFEVVGSTLPATFKPTWYRHLDRGLSMRAYEQSGDLTVSADELLFVDGDKTTRIPFARIQSVRWEPMPSDIANHWVIVRFTNDEGKAEAVGFRDGGRLGTRGRTGPIFRAVRAAMKKS